MNYQPREPEVSGLDEYQRILILLDERRFEEAQVRARLLLESGDISLLIRAKTHNLLCWTFIEGIKRAAPEAVLHGEEAVHLAERLCKEPLKVQALLNLACAYYQVADYETARETYQKVVALLTAHPGLLPCGMTIAHQGLAQIAQIQGQPRVALDFLETAELYCQDDESRFLQADLFRRKALMLVKLNQPEQAAEQLARIPPDSFTSGPRSLWWKTHLGFTTARVEIARGHFAAARTQIAGTLALAQELADLPVQAECTCLQALLDYADGRKDAHKRARAAITYAIHSGRRDVLSDIRERLQPYLPGEM
ncbi:MAG TPA: hypothetical protein VGK74_24395 [Symbiobacteriaceae bacterium]